MPRAEDESAGALPPPPRLFVGLFAFLILAAVLLAWRAVPVLEKFPSTITFAGSLDREEGFLALQAQRLRAGQSIYPSIEEGPWLVGNYPPVYPAVVAVLGTPSLSRGRAVSFIAGLAICALLIGSARHNTRFVIGGIIGAGYFLTTFEFAYWAPFARVDMLALAIAFGGIIASHHARTRRGIALAAVLLAAAIFTKQTQVIALAVAAGGMALNGRRRDALELLAFCAGIGAVVVLVLLAITGGEFWRHTVTYNANKMDWAQLVPWVKHLARFSGVAICAAFVAGIISFTQRNDEDLAPHESLRPILRLATLWVVAGFVEALSLAKAGAAANYLLDLQCALAWWMALHVGAMLPNMRVPGGTWRNALVPFLLGAGALATAVVPVPEGRWGILANVSTPAPGAVEGLAAVEELILSVEGETLCEDPIPMMRLGRDVIYQPFIMSQLAREEKWDDAPFTAMIDSGRFALIVTTQNLESDPVLFGFTPSMRDHILARYELVRRIGAGSVVYHAYAPKGAAHAD